MAMLMVFAFGSPAAGADIFPSMAAAAHGPASAAPDAAIDADAPGRDRAYTLAAATVIAARVSEKPANRRKTKAVSRMRQRPSPAVDSDVVDGISDAPVVSFDTALSTGPVDAPHPATANFPSIFPAGGGRDDVAPSGAADIRRIDVKQLEASFGIARRWDVALCATLRKEDRVAYSTGVSVGYNVFGDAWLNLGYNFLTPEDEDLSRLRFTAKGPFVSFRLNVGPNAVKRWLGR
jgi:hypothetical protein